MKWSLSPSVDYGRLRHSLSFVLVSSAWMMLWLFPSLAQGQLLVSSDGTPGLVVSYNPTTGAVTQNPFATPDRPFSMSSDGTDVYITSYNGANGSVGKYTLGGAVVNASLVTGLAGPYGIAVAGGEIYEVNQANQTVASFSTATGAANPLFATITGLGSPSGIALLGTSLYVVEQSNSQVSEWTLDGTLITQDFINSSGTTIAGFGNNLYLTIGSGVAEYNATTGVAINETFITGLNGSFGVSLTPDGSILYVTNNGDGTVGEYNALTGAVINASLITGLTSPLGIYAGLAGPPVGIYWDIPVGGPNGTWDTTSSFWSPSSTGGSQVAWVSGSDAVFSATDLAAAGSFTVTLGVNLSAGNITYRGGAAGSTLDIAVGVGNTITMANPTMNITVDPGTTLVIAPVIAGTGDLVLESGTLVLTGANTYTGGTTITAGTLQIGNGGTTGSIVGNVVDSGTLAFNHSDNIVFSGAVSGTGGLSQIGTGKVTLTGLNTYTGGTAVASGILSVSNDSFLGGPGGITLEGGELLTTGVNFASSRLVTLNAVVPANILAATTGTIATYSGVISGSGGLQVGDGSNAGTVVLTGMNTYLGRTTITGGATLSVDNDTELGNPNAGITLQGGKLVMNSVSFSSGRTITLGTGTNVLAAPDPIDFRNDTISGLIMGTGGLTIGDVNSSSLTVTLGNSGNTYSGGTTITGGATLEIDTPTDGAFGTGVLTLNGGSLSTTLDGFSSGRTITLMPNGLANILITGFFDTATYSGVISGTGGLTIGGGTIVISGDNHYSGGTTVTNGTLMVSDDTNFGAQNTGITLFGGEIVSTVEGFFSPRPILLIDEGDFPNVLAAGDGTTGSYGGVISGTSSLQIGNSNGPEATGIVQLSGLNTYTGGTLVTAGATLSIGANANLGAAGTAVTLQHGELLTTATFATTRPINLEQFSTFTNTLAAAAGTTMTYQGIITGDGPLQIGDGGSSGTVVFKANNTYVGDTTVAAHAVLSVDKDAELGEPSNGIKLRFGGELLTTADFVTVRTVNLNPPIVGPGGIVTPLGPVSLNILAAAPNTTATYTELVFGTGGLAIGDLKGNSGTVILTDVANSYTGGTVIQGGATLSVASDPILGDSTGGLTLHGGEFLTTGAAFTSARAITVGMGADIVAAASGTTANYTGVLSNLENQGGTLLIGDPAHPGTIILSGRNTYTGGTILQAGTLLVNNAQALGTGDVAVNGGLLAADPQPINVGGNYTQSAAGTLQLSIAGKAAGQFDTLNVHGDAGLNGTLALVNQGFHPQGGDRLQLITTGGLVTSRFATFQNPFTLAVGFNTVDLVYARQSVTLVFLNLATPVTPLPPATPGAPEVIETTDFSSFAFTPNQSAAASLLDAVQLDPKGAGLVSFFNQEPFANLTKDLQKISPDGLSAFYEIGFSNANIQKLTLESRLDDLHSGSNGFTSNMNVNGSTVKDMTNPDGKSSKAVMEPVLQHAPENRWGVWVTGFGDFVNVDGDGNAKGYNFTTGGVSLGLDFRLTDQLAIGVMGDYSHTWTSLNPGHIDVDSGRGGVYASWFNRGFYVNAAIYGGHNNYDSNRSGLGGSANGSTEGSEWSTFIGAGYDYHLGSLTIGPVASLQYTDVGIDQFSEKGSIAPLDIHSGSAESLRSDAGFRVFYQWQFGKLVIQPSLKAAWEHEYKYSALPITAGIAGIPGPSATFFGPSEGHDSAVLGAGVSVQLTSSIATYVNYDGQLGRGNYDSNAVTGGFRISF